MFIKNKRERLTKRKVEKRLDELLQSGLELWEMDGKELDHLMWSQPSCYLAFQMKMDKRR